jgi:hypothetical protein
MHTGHRRRAIVAKPKTAGEFLGQTDEHGVAIVRRSAGLAEHERMHRVRRPCRSVPHRPAQILQHGLRRPPGHGSTLFFAGGHADNVSLGADRGAQKADLRNRAFVEQGCVDLGQLHRRAVQSTERNQRRRARRLEPEALNDTVERLAELHGRFRPGPVAGMVQRKFQAERLARQAARAGFGRPVRAADRPRRDALLETDGMFMHADQWKQLPRRSDRTLDVRGPVPLARIVAGA